MPWYVALITNPTTTSGNVTAVVESFASEQAFQQATGTTPAQEGVPGQTNAGFPTRAAAQKVADAYNKSGAGLHATGAKPLAPNLATPVLHNPLTNLFKWQLGVTNISGWFTRALKVLFGGVLMIMGIAKLTHAEDQILKVAPIAAKALMV